MANVRFLDQVPVVAYANNNTLSGRVPRFLYSGEVLVVAENDQLYGYDFFNFGTVIIEQGKAVVVGDETYYSDGLLQIATVLTNNGLITNNGVLINSEEGNNF
tara:strand:- start:84 stop:392 length:309 start_codon:yes stop_codon:yes gene_type:complete